tara:strand:- start:248 stop:388 length:141 start_codon:yes stop_codon:yes gene_type:complete
MTRASTYERTHRSAPPQAFSGGYTPNQRILPMQRPGLLSRLLGRGK